MVLFCYILFLMCLLDDLPRDIIGCYFHSDCWLLNTIMKVRCLLVWPNGLTDDNLCCLAQAQGPGIWHYTKCLDWRCQAPKLEDETEGSVLSLMLLQWKHITSKAGNLIYVGLLSWKWWGLHRQAHRLREVYMNSIAKIKEELTV